MSQPHTHDPLRPHRHDPNPIPPSDDTTFTLLLPEGAAPRVTLAALRALPHVTLPECYIVSTGHGTSGPFAFGGARLLDLVRQYMGAAPWQQVEVLSADGFGNRVARAELEQPDPAGPILLAYEVDGRPLTRAEGAVRMIVRSERDDALRQVKWVGTIRVRA